MGFIFLSCGAHNAELIIVGQKLIPAVCALVFGLGPKSTKALYTIVAYGPSERIHKLTIAGWLPQPQTFVRNMACSQHAFRVRVSL